MIFIACLFYIALLLVDDGTDTNVVFGKLPRWLLRLALALASVLILFYTVSIKYPVEATSFRQVYLTVHDRSLTTAQNIDSNSEMSIQIEPIQPASQDDVSIVSHSTK